MYSFDGTYRQVILISMPSIHSPPTKRTHVSIYYWRGRGTTVSSVNWLLFQAAFEANRKFDRSKRRPHIPPRKIARGAYYYYYHFTCISWLCTEDISDLWSVYQLVSIWGRDSYLVCRWWRNLNEASTGIDITIHECDARVGLHFDCIFAYINWDEVCSINLCSIISGNILFICMCF